VLLDFPDIWLATRYGRGISIAKYMAFLVSIPKLIQWNSTTVHTKEHSMTDTVKISPLFKNVRTLTVQ
jgi:hypothetical protein